MISLASQWWIMNLLGVYPNGLTSFVIGYWNTKLTVVQPTMEKYSCRIQGNRGRILVRS